MHTTNEKVTFRSLEVSCILHGIAGAEAMPVHLGEVEHCSDSIVVRQVELRRSTGVEGIKHALWVEDRNVKKNVVGLLIH